MNSCTDAELTLTVLSVDFAWEEKKGKLWSTNLDSFNGVVQ